MPIETKLRLAAALLAAVPDARALIRRRDGAAVLAGRHPACDVTEAQLRVLAFAASRWCPGAGSTVEDLRDVELSGALVPEGAGLYRRRTGAGREERWLATTLAPAALAHLVEEHTDRCGAGITLGVFDDRDLGASVLRLAAEPDAGEAQRLDRAAFDLLTSCLVAELKSGAD